MRDASVSSRASLQTFRRVRFLHTEHDQSLGLWHSRCAHKRFGSAAPPAPTSPPCSGVVVVTHRLTLERAFLSVPPPRHQHTLDNLWLPQFSTMPPSWSVPKKIAQSVLLVSCYSRKGCCYRPTRWTRHTRAYMAITRPRNMTKNTHPICSKRPLCSERGLPRPVQKLQK